MANSLSKPTCNMFNKDYQRLAFGRVEDHDRAFDNFSETCLKLNLLQSTASSESSDTDVQDPHE